MRLDKEAVGGGGGGGYSSGKESVGRGMVGLVRLAGKFHVPHSFVCTAVASCTPPPVWTQPFFDGTPGPAHP